MLEMIIVYDVLKNEIIKGKLKDFSFKYGKIYVFWNCF